MTRKEPGCSVQSKLGQAPPCGLGLGTNLSYIVNSMTTLAPDSKANLRKPLLAQHGAIQTSVRIITETTNFFVFIYLFIWFFGGWGFAM